MLTITVPIFMYKILLAVVEFANGKGQESQQGVIFQLINNFLERKFKDHVKEASRKMSILLILNVRKSTIEEYYFSVYRLRVNKIQSYYYFSYIVIFVTVCNLLTSI